MAFRKGVSFQNSIRQSVDLKLKIAEDDSDDDRPRRQMVMIIDGGHHWVKHMLPNEVVNMVIDEVNQIPRVDKSVGYLKYRDLRQILTAGTDNQPSIEVRHGCIVFCLPPVTALVLPEKVLWFINRDVVCLDDVIYRLETLQRTMLQRNPLPPLSADMTGLDRLVTQNYETNNIDLKSNRESACSCCDHGIVGSSGETAANSAETVILPTVISKKNSKNCALVHSDSICDSEGELGDVEREIAAKVRAAKVRAESGTNNCDSDFRGSLSATFYDIYNSGNIDTSGGETANTLRTVDDPLPDMQPLRVRVCKRRQKSPEVLPPEQQSHHAHEHVVDVIPPRRSNESDVHSRSSPSRRAPRSTLGSPARTIGDRFAIDEGYGSDLMSTGRSSHMRAASTGSMPRGNGGRDRKRLFSPRENNNTSNLLDNHAAAGTTSPFHVHALEALLYSALCASKDDRHPLQKRVSSLWRESVEKAPSSRVLEALYVVKEPLQRLEARLNGIVEILQEVLENDDDLAAMDHIGGSNNEETSCLAEIENLFEHYDQEFSQLHSKTNTLSKKVEDAEQHISLKLSLTRNRLVLFELGASGLSVCVGAGAMVTGIFGMNLTNSLEEDVRNFYVVTALTCGCVLLCGTVIVIWLRFIHI